MKQQKAIELLNIGVQAYREGDYHKAQKYYEQSADLGNSQAACNLGYTYAYVRTGERDNEKALLLQFSCYGR